MIEFNEKEYRLAMLLAEALDGSKRAKDQFFEALTTDETPADLEPALNKAVTDAYEGIEVVWTSFAGRKTVDDFRIQESSKIGFDSSGIPTTNGGEKYVDGTLPLVPEMGEYPVIGITGTGVQFRLAKGGARFELSWERIINNRDLSELERAWSHLARMARNTEEVEATKQFVNASGLNTTNLAAANRLTGNTALSMDSLKAALAQAKTHTVDGHRVPMPATFNLMVPSTLEETAREILAIQEIRTTSGDTTTISGNPISGKFDLVVNDWMSILPASNGDTTWGILPKPGAIEDGGAYNAFLRGHEAPRFMIRNTTQGNDREDFDNDSVSTKVRHPLAGTFGSDKTGIVFSNGSGS